MEQNRVHILDDDTVNKIAAGEVVDRPASVIKELIENSIDANSRNIEVEIINGGIDYIRVTDDGIGMNSQDAQLAILRHATSKLRSAEDLNVIQSLGFRGEALPSIAAVAKFTLNTRERQSSLATFINVEGGMIKETREAGGSIGTTITVAELFYNTPARLKFLKTSSTESGYVNDVVTKMALSHPGIAFKLINNNRMVLATPGNDVLLDTVLSLYGNNIKEQLLPVYYEAEGFIISGYISTPTLLKSSRRWQTFIVNSRIINSRVIAKSLDNAYHSLLPKSGYPLTILNITVDCGAIDVNVHPQKSEIKFSDEQAVFSVIRKAVYNTLSSPVNSENSFVPASMPVFKGNSTQDTATSLVTHYIPYNHKQATNNIVAEKINIWQKDSQLTDNIGTNDSLGLPKQQLTNDYKPSYNVVEQLPVQPLGQIADCYIVARSQDGSLFIIDQHAAHERILFDKLNKNADRVPAQQLLVPLFLELDTVECNIVSDKAEVFHQLGFALEFAGPNTVRLLEIPSDIPVHEAECIIKNILNMLQQMKAPTSHELRQACFQMAACKAAIKAGDELNMRQIYSLLTELWATELPYTCPHGRPIIVKFGPEQLAKMFKRT